MKQFNYIFFLIFILSIKLIHSQDISEDYKQEIINSLSIINEDSSNTIHYGGNAIDQVIEYEIHEAIPAIIQNIWRQDPYYQTNFITALEVLDADETESFALALLDSIDSYDPERIPLFFTKLKLKLSVVRDLFDLGNYSKYQIVFDRIEEAKPDLEPGVIFMLPEIIWHYPEHEERAKEELIRFAYESSDDTYRWYAIVNIDTVYGADMLELYIDFFKTDSEYSTRLGILEHILVKYKSENVNSVLRQRLSEDPVGFNRYKIAEHLLKYYSSPSDYEFIKNYIPEEIEEEYREYIASEVEDFRPPKPDSSIEDEVMLDTLISYVDQSYKNKWINNRGIYNSLSKKLKNAKKNFGKGNSKSIIKKIEAFQNEVEAQKGKHITEDGYKFLYYYSNYLVERLNAGEIK